MVHVTPQDFGAVADGSDCTSAIQQALDAVCASGGTLRFPDGKYGVTSQISGTTDKTVNIIGSMGTGEESYIKVNAPITGSVIQLSSAGGHRGRELYQSERTHYRISDPAVLCRRGDQRVAILR